MAVDAKRALISIIAQIAPKGSVRPERKVHRKDWKSDFVGSDIGRSANKIYIYTIYIHIYVC